MQKTFTVLTPYQIQKYDIFLYLEIPAAFLRNVSSKAAKEEDTVNSNVCQLAPAPTRTQEGSTAPWNLPGPPAESFSGLPSCRFLRPRNNWPANYRGSSNNRALCGVSKTHGERECSLVCQRQESFLQLQEEAVRHWWLTNTIALAHWRCLTPWRM